jgi:hypothetical protein
MDDRPLVSVSTMNRLFFASTRNCERAGADRATLSVTLVPVMASEKKRTVKTRQRDIVVVMTGVVCSQDANVSGGAAARTPRQTQLLRRTPAAATHTLRARLPTTKVLRQAVMATFMTPSR